MTERMRCATALEQTLITGAPAPGDAVQLAGEVEDHLRALLRDLICGHLRGELSVLADTLMYTPDADAGTEAAPEFRVSRRTDSAAFASGLFTTPPPPKHPTPPAPRAEPVVDDAVFEPVTTELEVVAQPRRQAPPRPRPRKRTRQGS
jgi:hypothetical protein